MLAHPKPEPIPETTQEPTPEPTKEPSPEPTKEPTKEPNSEPASEPSGEPNPGSEPTSEPEGEGEGGTCGAGPAGSSDTTGSKLFQQQLVRNCPYSNNIHVMFEDKWSIIMFPILRNKLYLRKISTGSVRALIDKHGYKHSLVMRETI